MGDRTEDDAFLRICNCADQGETVCGESIREYVGYVVLVGISYSDKTKEHRCVIEKIGGTQTQNIEEWIKTQIRKNPKITTEEMARILGKG